MKPEMGSHITEAAMLLRQLQWCGWQVWCGVSQMAIVACDEDRAEESVASLPVCCL